MISVLYWHNQMSWEELPVFLSSEIFSFNNVCTKLPGDFSVGRFWKVFNWNETLYFYIFLILIEVHIFYLHFSIFFDIQCLWCCHTMLLSFMKSVIVFPFLSWCWLFVPSLFFPCLKCLSVSIILSKRQHFWVYGSSLLYDYFLY